MDNFKSEEEITLDDLDILISLLEAYQETMDKNDDDKEAVKNLVNKLNDFSDRVASRCEYIAGLDWPEDLKLHLSCCDEDIKKLTLSSQEQ